MPAAVAAAVGLLLLWVPITHGVRLQGALAGAVLVACAAVAWIAAARYRSDRDPQGLFMAVGFAVIAAQAVIFGIWWPQAHGPPVFAVTEGTSLVAYTPWPQSPVAPYAWLFGLLLAGILLTLGTPWWDRRGRRPVDPLRVTVLALAVVAVGDVAISIGFSDVATGIDKGIIAADPPGVILAALAAVALAVACLRQLRPGASALRGWLGASLAIAATIPLAQALRPTFGLDVIRWTDLAALAVPLIALGGLLAEQRAESSLLRRASDRAVAVIEGRAEVASMIAHDVRGPIGTITGLATTTRKMYDRLGDAERLEFIGMIETESSRLLALVDQIALALKIDAGSISFLTRVRDVAPVVRRGVEAADTTGHPIHVEAPADIEAPVDEKWVAEAVRQAVENAAKFSPDGAPITVILRRDAQGDVVIEVIDRGPGIPAERREALFEQFGSWRPPGYEQQQGSGLGLFIVRGIARGLQGDARLTDAPEGSSTMLAIRLPGEGMAP